MPLFLLVLLLHMHRPTLQQVRGQYNMKFAMQLEPVCDYRAYLRTLSCSSARLMRDVSAAVAELSNKDLCTFELGQPDRQCKVRQCTECCC